MHLAAGDFVGKALSFFAFVYLARVLGVASFGVLEFAFSVLTYFLLLADGGLELWSTREAAKAQDVRPLVARVVPLRVTFAVISFAVLGAALPLFPAASHARTVLLLFGLTLFPQAVSLKWVFMGRGKMSRVAAGLVFSQAVFAAAVLIFVHDPNRLVWVPVLRLVADSLMAVYFVGLFALTEGGLKVKLTLQRAREALRPALTIGTSQAMGLLNYNFDSVLLGFIMGTTMVGWYTAAYKPVVVVLALPITYFIGLMPALSRSYANDRGEFRHLIYRSLQMSTMLAVPIVVGGMLLAEPIIALLYGPAYARSAQPFRILVWSAALVILRSTYTEALKATGHQNFDVRCAITSAIVNVGLNLLLIPRYGMLGAASATVTGDVVWMVMAYYYFHREVLSREVIPSLRDPLWAGAGMALFLYVGQPVPWVARAVLAVMIYFGILLAFGNAAVRSWVHLRGRGADQSRRSEEPVSTGVERGA